MGMDHFLLSNQQIKDDRGYGFFKGFASTLCFQETEKLSSFQVLFMSSNVPKDSTIRSDFQLQKGRGTSSV